MLMIASLVRVKCDVFIEYEARKMNTCACIICFMSTMPVAHAHDCETDSACVRVGWCGPKLREGYTRG